MVAIIFHIDRPLFLCLKRLNPLKCTQDSLVRAKYNNLLKIISFHTIEITVFNKIYKFKMVEFNDILISEAWFDFSCEHDVNLQSWILIEENKVFC